MFPLASPSEKHDSLMKCVHRFIRRSSHATPSWFVDTAAFVAHRTLYTAAPQHADVVVPKVAHFGTAVTVAAHDFHRHVVALSGHPPAAADLAAFLSVLTAVAIAEISSNANDTIAPKCAVVNAAMDTNTVHIVSAFRTACVQLVGFNMTPKSVSASVYAAQHVMDCMLLDSRTRLETKHGITMSWLFGHSPCTARRGAHKQSVRTPRARARSLSFLK